MGFGIAKERSIILCISLQKRLEWLELQAPSPAVVKDLRETRVELNCWLDKEDAMWAELVP